MVGCFSGISMHWKLSQYLVHRDMYKSNHTYYRRTFLSSLLKSFLRILLRIWRGITRDPKYKAIPEMYKYVLTDRRSQYRDPQVSLIPDR
jgi:hypothetical protein